MWTSALYYCSMHRLAHYIAVLASQVMGLSIGLSFTLLVIGAAITSYWVLFVDLVFVLILPIVIVLFHLVNPKHDNWDEMTIG